MKAFWQNLFFFLRALPQMAWFCALFRHRMRGTPLTAAGRKIPDGFLGISVAGSEEAGYDNYVVGCLNELGIKNVRLDLSSGKRFEFTEKFLRRLLNDKFRVCLHLVQPPAEARRMCSDAGARENWRSFVAGTLAACGREVEMVEIGSTCNRRKWSGYSLPAYLQAWRIACEVAAVQNISLAAPNVTDFEPFYNVALLAAMKRRNILPALHTDNLFVERAVEPEVYDRKIAGKWLADLFKLDLVRKADVLNNIAAGFGVPGTVCSQVSWSLRRIARFLEDAEEKQADYLARYCCLAAAGGALKRVYWGPLIGQREGLIDDGTTEFPEIPHVTYYGNARGSIKDYRLRPAFQAFKTVNRFINGTTYLRKIPCGYGLEIHEFEHENGLLHMAWTMNGKRAMLGDCYAKEILETAVIYDRDGSVLQQVPAMITESPIYICMPACSKLDGIAAEQGRSRPTELTDERVGRRPPWLGVASEQSRPAAPLDRIIFAPSGQQVYNYIETNGMSGVCLAVKENLILNAIQALDVKEFQSCGGAGTLSPYPLLIIGKGRATASRRAVLFNKEDAGGFELLRDSRNRVWCGTISGMEKKLVFKMFRPPGAFRRLFARIKGDKGLRSWNGANELLRRGIFTPRPIAFLHQSDKPLSAASWYVCEAFENSFSVRQAFNAFTADAKEFEGMAEPELYRQIALFIRKMHDRGVFFRDLSAGNLLFRGGKENGIEFALIDTARAVFYDRSLTLLRRLCDLMRICHPLCWRGRKVFLAAYMALIGRRYRAWMNIPLSYYDWKHSIKGKIRR
jgi:hypothetical protein